jgi:hypothetical protein
MLKTSRFYANRLVLSPSTQLDPATTVEQLFAEGPVRLEIERTEEGLAQVSIDAPGTLVIQAETTGIPAASDAQGDLFHSGSQSFDVFLDQERERIDLESEAVDELREARSKTDEPNAD